MAKKNSKKTVPDLRFRGFTDPWEQRQLGEVGLTYPGLSGKTKEDFGHGDARFVTYMNVYSNAVANPDGVEAIEKDDRQHEVMNGDVFFTGSSETPDEVGLSSVWLGNSTDTYLNSFCFGYRPSKQLDSLFLASSLRSPQMRSRIILLAQGISRFNISKTQVMQLPLCFPSLPEQRRIGDFFSILDGLIAAAERQETLLRQKKQAYLQLMFPQDGETEPRLRFQEFSDSWERHQLGEVIRPIKVIPVSRYSRHGRFPVIQQGDHPIAGYSSDEPYFQYSNVVLFGDHTLSLYRPESPFLLASDGLKVLSCDFPGNDFLYAMLERYKPSNEGYKRHFSILKKQHCSFPSLPEQRRIGGFFSTLDNLIAAAEQRAESLRALKSAYLQRMFA
ncbi:type I restriction enzyme specificity protein [Bifidobacterium thermophilum]|uniref:restriction endonuclease subunit S n=1 Tax=Bifidobacterium thermophilum TaxID=33905 RepID=UPI000CB0908C|nr:restriction endonuclease subunit S [Bifidobacterium thermophilum]PKU89768.1 type I restriction enzyme specificity protein [Bifidobacterium thermophilum]